MKFNRLSMTFCFQCLKETMSIVVYTHDQLDIYTVEIGKFSRRADNSIYIFIYIEEQPTDSYSEQS